MSVNPYIAKRFRKELAGPRWLHVGELKLLSGYTDALSPSRLDKELQAAKQRLRKARAEGDADAGRARGTGSERVPAPGRARGGKPDDTGSADPDESSDTTGKQNSVAEDKKKPGERKAGNKKAGAGKAGAGKGGAKPKGKEHPTGER